MSSAFGKPDQTRLGAWGREVGDVWFPAPTSAWAALEGPLSDWGWEETPFLWMLEPVLACCVASGSLVSLSEAPWQAILYCVLLR